MSDEEIRELSAMGTALGGMRWVQGPGGNVSVKTETELFIKASGTLLRDVGSPTGHVRVPLTIAQRAKDGDEEADRALFAFSPRPSLETYFHAFDARVVAHTHALGVLLHACSTAPAMTEPLVVEIPYIRPGRGIAVAMEEALKGEWEERVVILRSHGIVALARSATRAIELTERVDALTGGGAAIDAFAAPYFEVLVTEIEKGVMQPLPQRAPKADRPRYLFPDAVVCAGSLFVDRIGDATKTALAAMGHGSIVVDGEGNRLAVAPSRSKLRQTCEVIAAHDWLEDALVARGVVRYLDDDEPAKIVNMPSEQYRIRLEGKRLLIFIPMAGTGDRYIRAGYTQPKPLIPVDGVPMIERVLEAFPRSMRFLFGVNRTHAETTDLIPTLERLRPGATIVVMDPHKDGPVQSVLSCSAHIPDDEDVCLSYCDFGVEWSFDGFARWLDEKKWDAAMTAYRGFHPHSLGPTLYAYMRNTGDRVTEIREKHHFTAQKLDEYASSGLYWFRHGRDLLRRSQELVASGERVQGEFYVSMLMESVIEQGGSVGVYELERFFQWGTPEDLRDYESWASAMRGFEPFLSRAKSARSRGAQVIPMAGLGQRFADEGYVDPKPLIDVAGRPMIARVMQCLPEPTERVLVVRAEHAKDAKLVQAIEALPRTRILEIQTLTDGQACTAKLGVDALTKASPILCASCDAGYIYDIDAWKKAEASGADMIIFSARGHLPAIWRPQMYGWILAVDGRVQKVAVKKLIEGHAAADQEVITGTFWFKDSGAFQREVAELVRDDERINNELYIDTIARRMVERGADVRAFTVQKYVPWGTPAELRTFAYWNDVHRKGQPLP